MSLPWDLNDPPLDYTDPVMVVDLRRCTGCHACAIACKVEHRVPLGAFHMRVRWMPSPDGGAMAFLPVFDAALCDYGADRAEAGLAPACVAACPTGALIFGDAADPSGPAKAQIDAGARALSAPGDTHPGVRYRGLADWQEGKLNSGVAPHPDDDDPIYELGPGQSLVPGGER